MNPPKTEKSTEKKREIPGWGADLDPKNRPAVPKEKRPPRGTGAHWLEPERQIPRVKIHKSTERTELTPVFGTSCPPRGLSGLIRDWAYTLSEGDKRHWLLLLAADRVDVVEGILIDLFHGKVANPFSEMGLGTEFRRGGFFSRFGENRNDVNRIRNELLLVAAAGLFFSGRRAALRNRRSDDREPHLHRDERVVAA